MAGKPSSDAYAAFQAWEPEAQALDSSEVAPYRLDPDLAIINIDTGMQVIDEFKDEVRAHLPRIDLDRLRRLPELALAVKFAAMQAELAATDGTMSEMLAEAREIRSTLLRILSGLAAAELIPESTYEAIVQGTGARDMAEDCVALNKVFRDHARAIEGKHAADPAMIERAGVVGTWLLQNLRKAGAPPERTSSLPEVDTRNRLATLLVRQHERLQVVAHYFYGKDYESYAPPLMSRKLARRRSDAGQEPAAAEPEPVDPAS